METNIPEKIDVRGIAVGNIFNDIVIELRKIRRSDIDYREYKRALKPYIKALRYKLETLPESPEDVSHGPGLVITLEELGRLTGKYMKKVDNQDCENLGLAWALQHQYTYIDAEDIKKSKIDIGDTTLTESINETDIEPSILANGFRYNLLEEEFWSIIIGLESNCPLVFIEQIV